VRDYIHRRVWEVLTGQERGADFAAISDAERSAIVDILRDTLPEGLGHE
jgi:hypothetical protein